MSHKWPSHLRTKSHCAYWVRALLATGMTFEIVILEETARDDLPNAERWWIAYGLASSWPLTNLTDGGESAKHAARAKLSRSLMKHAVSSETRAKMSAARKIRMNMPEYREAARARALVQWGSPAARATRSERWLAMPVVDREAHLAKMRTAAMTPTARAKNIESNRAVKESPEFRAKASARMRVRMADPAERAKISAATKEAMARPEIRAKMRAKALGRKRSPSTRAKISATLRARRLRVCTVSST